MIEYNVFISIGAISDEFLTDPFLIKKIETKVSECGAVPFVHQVDKLSEKSITDSIVNLGKSNEYWAILTPSVYDRLPYIWMEVAIMRYRRMIENQSSIEIIGIGLYLPRDENYKTKLPVILRPKVNYNEDEYEPESLYVDLKRRVLEYKKRFENIKTSKCLKAKAPNIPIDSKSLRIFISYSKSDKHHKETLLNHLSGLHDKIVIWDDHDLMPGEDWDQRIKTELHRADVVLYLVSHNSMATDYIQNIELKLVKQLCRRNECVLIPIILDFCLWETDLDIAKNNVLPEKGIPITNKDRWINENEGWVNVVAGIDRIVSDIISIKHST